VGELEGVDDTHRYPKLSHLRELVPDVAAAFRGVRKLALVFFVVSAVLAIAVGSTWLGSSHAATMSSSHQFVPFQADTPPSVPPAAAATQSPAPSPSPSATTSPAALQSPPAVVPSQVPHILSYSAIEAVWIVNGGDPAHEADAACIAEKESGGNIDANNGADVGLWQIDRSHMGENGIPDTWKAFVAFEEIPAHNADEAILLSANGTDWGQWTTHALCGV
jgi:hypothetical protein